MGFFSKLKQLTTLTQDIEKAEILVDKLKSELYSLNSQVDKNQKLLDDQNLLLSKFSKEFDEKNEAKRLEILKEATLEADKVYSDFHDTVKDNQNLLEENTSLKKENMKLLRQGRRWRSDIQLLKEIDYNDIITSNYETYYDSIDNHFQQDSLLDTISKLHLHSDDSKELRKLSNATKKEISTVLSKYETNYTTKANKTIYSLMVIGLQAEIKILMYNLTTNKISESKDTVEDIINKFLIIAGDGNKSILPTVTKFLLEIKPLYIELLEIEYKYFIYREREKEEQRLLKEQMKQEAEERKEIEKERKKLEVEEGKYITEIEKTSELLKIETDDAKMRQLQQKIQELQEQLLSVEDKKEEIASLALGKAGYVYIISNVGSFGENVFKIGMTRRLEPQQRIDELGSASVPFKFDVHAFIFSDNAVGLENKLHRLLTEERVNKVNLRKEFFKVDIKKIETVVEDIDPTASFNKTILAQEYRQSIAMIENEI
ncbi:MAG: GIY-YIG nuclease family protein [Lactococcus plantarum]|nr:GIY-YIG nuclease family protein [Lactococcus plantarum]